MSKRMDKATKERGDAELAIDSDEAIKAILSIATYLGAFEEWPGSEMLEGIAEDINDVLRKAGLPTCSDQSDSGLKYWRRQADLLGYEYDGDY